MDFKIGDDVIYTPLTKWGIDRAHTTEQDAARILTNPDILTFMKKVVANGGSIRCKIKKIYNNNFYSGGYDCVVHIGDYWKKAKFSELKHPQKVDNKTLTKINNLFNLKLVVDAE